MQNKQCACCGQNTLDASVKFFDICPACGWEDDPVQNKKPDFDGGANHISLNEAKKAFADGKNIHSLQITAMERYNEKQQFKKSENSLPLTAALV